MGKKRKDMTIITQKERAQPCAAKNKEGAVCPHD